MLEKQTVVDRIEVIEVGVVQVRTATRIVEDGKVISQSYHRHTISPGQDYSGEDARVQAICAATHTSEVISAYQAIRDKYSAMQAQMDSAATVDQLKNLLPG